MSGIILFQSKYGATKKYADWLSEELGFPCVETKKARISEVVSFDAVILGGGIYASGIAGLSFLKKNIDSLNGKKIAVFCCGASPYDEDAFKEVIKHNMKDDLENIPVFYCRGSWDMEKMSFADRTLCNMLRKAVSKKDPSEYEIWEKALMAAGNDKCDWTDKEYLKPLVEFINK
ncbi:MAG: flavodoxin [Oscillospiraceae bacterium]|jgi:menaquinone-dependent protoporphyrinogen IX oxidase|nr:flavodoxin [Oscillospiraceae bacterium]